MDSILIRMARVDWAAHPQGPATPVLRVIFKIGNDPSFEIPIWLPATAKEEDAIRLARDYLHEVSSDLFETTKKWKLSDPERLALVDPNTAKASVQQSPPEV